MPGDFIPRREADLVTWSENFKTKITAAPTTYGLTAAMATAYTTLHNSFVTAYQTANHPDTRSPTNITLKNAAKASLIANARQLSRTVQGTATVTAAQKQDLGLNVRDIEPTPIPVPSSSPQITVKVVSGFNVRLRISDPAHPTRRGLPLGVDGIAVFSYVGEESPTDINAWKFEGNTTRTEIDVVFPNTTAAGAKVWLTAFYFNPRKESGAACAPISTNVQGGTVGLAA